MRQQPQTAPALLAEVRNPHPAQALVFVDEHENSVQQGLFAMNHPNFWEWPGTTVWTWLSAPATRHGNSGTVSFADGHAAKVTLNDTLDGANYMWGRKMYSCVDQPIIQDY